MEKCEYVVDKIDGDYVHLRRNDVIENDFKLVARAILPSEIAEGTSLNYEFFEYTIV
jgi:predicted dithiol-disulfide oxidoreductase (DUF899 family)